MKSRTNILKEKESKAIMQLSLPMMYGFLSVVGVSLVDAFFIGKLGTHALAAFGFIFPLIMFFNGIILGVANGASALSARAFGAGDIKSVRRLTTDAIMLGICITFILSIITYLFDDLIFTSLGAPPEILILIKEYVHIWLLGSIFVVFPMIGNNAMTAIGNTKSAANVMLLVLLFNTIFDPIFIFGLGPIPALGFRGAAVATIASRIFIVIIALYILIKKDKIIDLSLPKIKDVLNSWKDILYIGLPNALTNIILPLGFSIITHLASYYGKEAVAALSVAERIESLALTVMMSFAVAMSPFIGQNLGAKQFGRIKTGLRKSIQYSTYWGAFLFLVLFFFSDKLILIFNNDPIVIQHFRSYFNFLPFSYPFLGYIFVTGVTLNVFKKPFHSAILTLTRVFIVYIPLAYLFTSLMQVDGIFLASMLANIITSIFGFYLLKKYRKKIIGE